MKPAASIRTSAVVAGLTILLDTSASAQTDLGVVLEVHGTPFATDPFGTRRRLEALQGLEEGDTLDVGAAESVVVCNQAVQSVYRIEGPGVVGVAQTGFGRIRGTPQVTSLGACDADARPDSNGGVILRTLRRRPRTP